ncbi:hypothetical protein OUZ56_013570 [Daphnia magna]|uniref:Uncharacterized protein n=1 Tax=Daphnia magna TaxID=35525 RepID=A0ABQ9Z6A3_9CRUS|nr:hypothetical protein OUZ56_013570 [Daphnia magna]
MTIRRYSISNSQESLKEPLCSIEAGHDGQKNNKLPGRPLFLDMFICIVPSLQPQGLYTHFLIVKETIFRFFGTCTSEFRQKRKQPHNNIKSISLRLLTRTQEARQSN